MRSSPPLSAAQITRRQLLAVASAAAFVLESDDAEAQRVMSRPVVFAHTTVVNVDSVHDDVALAVDGDKIVAIGPTETITRQYPNAEVYDGRGKAILPGLINCHAHLTATLGRGFNEDFGFPNSAHLAVNPESLISGDEQTLMATIGALECIRSGTTSVVEVAGGIGNYASALAQTGLRCVFAEAIADSDSVLGPMSVDALARSGSPRYSAKRLNEGMQRISDLYSSWHGAKDGRITVFPSAALAETSSPELLQAVRAFAEKHDLGYTIHLSQSRAEIDYMVRHNGLRPPAFLAQHGFLGPRLFAAHCRYVDAGDIALLAHSHTIVSHQAAMAANRGVIPPITALRAAGCPIAYGTDNNTNDMLEGMRVALLTERIARDDPFPGIRPQPEDMLEDATRGGAATIRAGAMLGTLEVGKKADLIVLDTQRVHLVPAGRIVSAWVHNGQPSDVESVMVNGEFIMRDHKILTLDEPALVAEADQVGRRVWAQVKAAGPVAIPGRRVS
jgi:5-methylthioadenosine/S-adenosylhomocysteine deaminase